MFPDNLYCNKINKKIFHTSEIAIFKYPIQDITQALFLITVERKIPLRRKKIQFRNIPDAYGGQHLSDIWKGFAAHFTLHV